MAAPITTCAAAGKHRGVRNGEVQSGNFKSENMWRRQDVFQCVHKWSEHIENSKQKLLFFPPKKNIHHRNTKSKKRRKCNFGEICTFQRQKSTYFGCCFFKRIISVNLGGNLKNKISNFRLSNIIHFCYCTLFFHF